MSMQVGLVNIGSLAQSLISSPGEPVNWVSAFSGVTWLRLIVATRPSEATRRAKYHFFMIVTVSRCGLFGKENRVAPSRASWKAVGVVSNFRSLRRLRKFAGGGDYIP